MLVTLALLLVSSTTLTSCSTPTKDKGAVKSLCIFDEKFENCWIDKPKGLGFTIEELKNQQAACYRNEVPCFFGLDSQDLSRIHQQLNQGR